MRNVVSKKVLFILAIGLYFFTVGCNKKTEDLQLPVVQTLDVKNIGFSSAIVGGDVVDDKGLQILVKGVCWGTSANPTINKLKTDNGGGSGKFDSALGGLSSSTTYFVRAYATNENGTTYGKDISFKTLAK